jgi:3-isopropylmalate dehydratase small subunit
MTALRGSAWTFGRDIDTNTGLPILVAPEAAEGIKQGDELMVDLASGEIDDLTSGAKYEAQPLPPFMQELVAAGGLLAYLKSRAASG